MPVNNFSPIQKTMQMQSYIDGQKSSLPLSVQPSSSDQEGCPKLRHWQQKGKKVQSIMWLHNCLREKVEINVFEKYISKQSGPAEYHSNEEENYI